MTYYSIGPFEVDFKPGWRDVTEDDGPLTLAREEEHSGALQFTAGLYRAGRVPDPSFADLRALLQGFADREGLHLGAVEEFDTSPLKGVSSDFRREGFFQRVWYVSDGRSVALVTYTCDDGFQDDELAECLAMVSTMRFAER